MTTRPTLRLLAALCVALSLVACREEKVGPREAIVLLVSIDGFRWDYLEKFKPPTLTALAASGVRSEGLVPQFPSKTFPNHYTIVTGMRLASHGVISNNMTDPVIPGRFSLRNREVQEDPRWWGGEPIWNTAERQGRRSSAMFWPGSEVRINGRQPTYWTPFDDGMPHDERVDRTLKWLALPEGERPSFLTLYFSAVDTAGHRGGPDSDMVRHAVAQVDAALARLVQGVERLGLTRRLHYVVVSDHGMSQLSPERMIRLDQYIDVNTVDVVDWSPVVTLSPKDGNVDALYAALKDRHPHLAVYRSTDLPARFRLAGHPRLPAVVGVAAEGWHITSTRDMESWGTGDRIAPGGNHGYDPELRSMHGLFIAAGSRLKRGEVVPSFENIHLYEFMCAILGLQPAENDGDPAATRALFR